MNRGTITGLGSRMEESRRPAGSVAAESLENSSLKARVPVIVLNWNGLDDTIQCVDALLESRQVALRVLLVDNGSADGDLQRLRTRYESDKRVELRRNEDNLGFTRGVNAVLRDL